MRLLELDIRGFGRLQGRYPLEAGEGKLGLLLAPNEAGKSTLAAAVLAALYGVEGDRRRARNKVVEQELHRPWRAPGYGLVLRLSHGDRELVVDRDFADGSARVLEGGRDVTDEFRRGGTVAVGEELLGLTRGQFVQSCFVGQGDIDWGDASGLGEALQRAADRNAKGGTAQQALELLERSLREYDGHMLARKGQVDTEIDRCAQRLAEVGVELGQLEAKREELAPVLDELSRSEALDREARRREDELKLRAARHERDAIAVRLAADDEAARRIEAAEAELEQGAALLELPLEELPAANTQRGKVQVALDEAAAADAQRERTAAAAAAATAAWEQLGLREVPAPGEAERLATAAGELAASLGRAAAAAASVDAAAADLEELRCPRPEAEALATVFVPLEPEDRDALATRESQLARRGQVDREHESDHRSLEQRSLAQRARDRRFVTAGAVAATLGGIAWALPQWLAAAPVLGAWPAWWPLAGVALAAGGLAFLLVAWLAGGGERARVAAAREELQEAVAAEATRRHGEDEAFAARCARLGLEPVAAVRSWKQWRAVERPARRLHGAREDAARAQAEAGARREQLAAAHQRLLGTVPEGDDALLALPARLEGATQLASARDEARREQHRAQEDATRRHAELAAAREQLVEALRRFGVEAGDDPSGEGAFGRLARRCDEARRLRQLRDEELPRLQAGRLSRELRRAEVDHLAELERSLERLSASLAALGVDPDQGDAARPLAPEAAARALEELQAQERVRHEREDEGRLLARSFLQQYEERAPRLRAEHEELERAHRRATQFRDAVTLAREELDRIRRETHRQWAAALNEQLPKVLSGLGSEVERLELDPELRLTLRRDGQLLDEQQARQHLSTGAREGVWLACRLAVSRYLAEGGEALPVVLDDPFANADDGRLLSGLRLLLGAVAPRQQVLLLACQRSRYDWALEQLGHPENLARLEPPGFGRGQA